MKKRRYVTVTLLVGSDRDYYNLNELTTEQIDALARELELLVDKYGGELEE